MADPLPFGVGSPAEPPVDQAGTLNGLAGAIWNFPKHLIDASANAVPGLRREDYTDNPSAPQPNQPLYDAAGETALGLMGGSGWAPAEANSLRMGIKAFHGSPHDFDKFDMSKIGTGEGAQVYGHGLYFAGNEKTAKWYRDTLSRSGKISLRNGDFYYQPSQVAEALGLTGKPESYAFQHALGEMQRGASLQDAMAFTRQQYPPEIFAKGNDAFKKVEKLMQEHNPKVHQTGKMYEVNIHADPDRLLDLNMPLVVQNPHVQNVVRELLGNRKIGPADNGAAALRTMMGTPAGRSKLLDDEGVYGLKYFDQSSRTPSANPTHNYVAFNDKIIEILKKYGIAGVPAAGAAAGVAQEQEKQ